jgi:hypothetical protein
MSCRACCALLAVLAGGCGSPPPAPPDTGARAAVQAYFEALTRQDWDGAYRALDADSRSRCDLARFTQRARAYRRNLGFEPVAVHVRACEEHGAEATAHVVLTGSSASRARQYRDAVTLRCGPSGWGVVLPSRFGQAGPS